MKHSRAARQMGLVALTAALVTILAGCGGGGGGGGGSTPPPSGNPNPPQTSSRLTVTGTVTDAPIANAVVTATVDGQTFRANADANGKYSLEITLPQNATSGFVTLNAKGVGAQSYVEFTSLLGTFSSLLTQAGSDAILSSTENFGTQITNVSTALAVLLKEANGGQAVSSETSIQTLSAGLNSQDILDLATAIKLLVDAAEDYPMPNGQTSLSALLSNTTVREQLVDAVYLLDRATFVATQNAIVSDATVIKPITPAALPSNLLASTLPIDDDNTYAGVDRAVAYAFNANGTGTASTGSWHRNTTWRVSGGSIEVAFDDPIPMWVTEPGVCPELGYGYAPLGLPVDYRIEGVTLRQLSDRMLAVTEDRVVTYRECGGPTGAESVTVARTLIDASNSQSIDPAGLRDSTRTLWVYDAYSEPPVEDTLAVVVMPDIADLQSNGTGTTRVLNKQFTWAVDASGKVITATFTDGTVAKYRSLREIDSVATDVLYDLALPTGRRNVGAGVSIHADPARPFAFTADNVPGRLYSLGIGEDGAPPGDKGYRYRFEPGGAGSGEDDFVDEFGNIEAQDANQHPSWARFWYIDNQDLVIERTRSMLDPTVYNCAPGMDPMCLVDRQWRIFPLAAAGARSYSLGIFRSSSNGVDESSWRETYIAMYDHEGFGESVPSGKPRVAAKNSVRQTRAIGPAQLEPLRESRERRSRAHH